MAKSWNKRVRLYNQEKQIKQKDERQKYSLINV